MKNDREIERSFERAILDEIKKGGCSPRSLEASFSFEDRRASRHALQRLLESDVVRLNDQLLLERGVVVANEMES